MFKILDEGQGQGLWETLLGIVNLQNSKLFHCYVGSTAFSYLFSATLLFFQNT
jgi:hypothetical protein